MSQDYSQDESFVPERVDEQIEALAQQRTSAASTRSEALIQTLHTMYTPGSLDAEDRVALERVRQKLRQRTSQGEIVPPERQDAERPGMATLHNIEDHRPVARRPSRRVPLWLTTLIAVLIIAILAGSLLVFTSSRHAQTATQPGQSTQAAYVITNQVLYKLDGRNGSVIWQRALPTELMSTHLIEGNRVYVFFFHGIAAYDATTGYLVWQRQLPMNIVHDVADGQALYVQYQDGTLAAFSTKNGAQLWQSSVKYEFYYAFNVQNGTIYVTRTIPGKDRWPQYQYLCALNSATGQQRWQTEMMIGGSNIADIVTNSVVYLANGLYLYALNAQTGKILWRQYSNDIHAAFSQLYLSHGVLYTETISTLPVPAQWHIYTFRANDGKLLWSSHDSNSLVSPNSDIDPVASTSLPLQTSVLLATTTGEGKHTLTALNLQDGSTKWQLSLPAFGDEGTLINGKLYLVTSSPILPDNHVLKLKYDLLVIDVNTGHLLANRPLPIGRMDSIGEQQLLIMDNAGNNTNNITTLYSIRLTDGKVLWQKSFPKSASAISFIEQAP